MRARKARVVTAERFQLVDQEGRTRAELKTADDGSPHFILRDAAGNLTAVVRGTAPPAFQLSSAAGTKRNPSSGRSN